MKKLLILLALTTIGADSPDALIRYRQTTMKSMGAHMSAIKFVVDGKVTNRALLAAHAQAVHGVSLGLTDLFPKLERSPSAARPEIWSDPKGFRAAAAVLERESSRLAVLASKNDWKAFDAQFARVADACEGCHRKYRQRDTD